MTDKVLVENEELYKPIDLTDKLKQIFEVEKVVLIPWIKDDIYGHADGMVRFLDEQSLLVNDFSSERPSWQNEFERAFKKELILIIP